MYTGDRNGDELDDAAAAAVQPNIYLYEVGGNIGMLPSAISYILQHSLHCMAPLPARFVANN